MVEVQFRKMTRDDVDEVYAIETENFSYPWEKEAFIEECQNDMAYYIVGVAEKKSLLTEACGLCSTRPI